MKPSTRLISFIVLGASLTVSGAHAATSCVPPEALRPQIKVETKEAFGLPYSFEKKEVIVMSDLKLCSGRVYEGIRFLIKQSGVTLDCDSAIIRGMEHPTLKPIQKSMIPSEGIFIQSSAKDPLRDVTVKNCTIEKPNAIGVQVVSSWEDLQPELTSINSVSGLDAATGVESPETQAIKQKFRDRGPKNIVIENVKVLGAQGNGMNINVGVSGVTIRKSTIEDSGLVGVYFSAYSFENRLESSTFRKTGKASREFVAIDASAQNVITRNRFEGNGEMGGIYLYKNCFEHADLGESIPRNQNSHGNLISENEFLNLREAIWIASRQNLNQVRTGCGDASPFIAGSNSFYKRGDEKAYFLDYAEHNRIERNVFRNNVLPIRVEDSHTRITGNRFVKPAGAHVIRIGTMNRSLIGNPVTDVSVSDNGTWEEQSTIANLVDVAYGSRDIRFEGNETNGKSIKTGLDPAKVNFVRDNHFVFQSVKNSNAGLTYRFACPNGGRIVSIKALCNLESTKFTRNELESLEAMQAPNSIRVFRTSTNIVDGSCTVGADSISQDVGALRMRAGAQNAVDLGCQEKDANGGDCAIAASIVCER